MQAFSIDPTLSSAHGRPVGRVGGVGVCKHQVVQLAYRLFPAMALAGSVKKNELIGIPDEKVWVKRPLRCLPLPLPNREIETAVFAVYSTLEELLLI